MKVHSPQRLDLRLSNPMSMQILFELTANSNQWALVLAGVSDFARPAESLSLTQNAALTATGAIWTRWCLIIKPKNILYAAALPTLRYRILAGANLSQSRHSQLLPWMCWCHPGHPYLIVAEQPRGQGPCGSCEG